MYDIEPLRFYRINYRINCSVEVISIYQRFYQNNKETAYDTSECLQDIILNAY